MLLIFTILESTEKTVSKMKAWCLIFALISEQVSSQSSSYSSSYSYASSGSTSEATNSSTDTTTATTTTTTTTTTTDPTTTTTAATTTTTTTTTTTAPTTTTAATTTSVSTTTAAVTTTSVSTTTTAPTTTSTAATTTTAPTTTTTAATTTTAPTTTTTAATTTTTAATTTSVSTTTAAVTTTSVSTTSTAPTTITATTTTSVVCQNEGELCNNFCKCPDKWSGPDCSIANHCVIITKDKYTFPETVIGYSAYSKETCQNDINAGFSKATAVCMNASGTIEFGPPNEMNCSLMLSAIDKYLSDHSDEISIQVLAYSTQILTSRPEHLTSSNITSAANILNQIFSMKTSDTTVAVAAMTTVSQLLFVSPQLVTGHDTELYELLHYCLWNAPVLPLRMLFPQPCSFSTSALCLLACQKNSRQTFLTN
uniref:EGF-like domain-containing protein n=1 Tax=Denticeps clupeoides TaxID=299321 RepID=A0AAY4BIT7_9TELE